MRTLGIIFLSLLPIAIGIIKSHRLRLNFCILREIKKLCLVLAQQMRYCLKEPLSLYEFVETSPEFSSDLKKVVSAISGKTEYGEIFSSLEALGENVVPKAHLGAVSDIFYGLGRSDLEAQLAHLGYFAALFEAEEQKARERYDKKGGLWLGLSIALGAAVFVLLI